MIFPLTLNTNLNRSTLIAPCSIYVIKDIPWYLNTEQEIKIIFTAQKFQYQGDSLKNQKYDGESIILSGL